MKKIIITTVAMLGSYACWADLKPMAEDELQAQTGQTGITISAKMEFGEDTRISYSNTDASFSDSQETWLVMDQITGSIEMKGLKIDLKDGLGPQQDKSALVMTLPEEVLFDHYAIEGVYVGLDKDVDRSGANTGQHVFLMGVDVDGVLSMPAETKINIFPAEKPVINGLN
ncbi:DUF6160 family protein [Bacterioplanoides pacificum]|uniref:DUF6160 family protein n=1 Tax=Bacterioplanoides pacificum TaxID=1171596 RepID=A0ABV7VWB6_9GAMM